MKYPIQRDGLSMTITANSREEAELDFAARQAQKVRTTEQIQAEAMTPAALAVKRQTKGIKG